jgi:hypothetical protein
VCFEIKRKFQKKALLLKGLALSNKKLMLLGESLKICQRFSRTLKVLVEPTYWVLRAIAVWVELKKAQS